MLEFPQVPKLSKKQKIQMKSDYLEGIDTIPFGYNYVNGRIIRVKNITAKFKKKDWQEVGFKTVKEGKAFIKQLNKKDLLPLITTKTKLIKLKQFVNDESNKIKTFFMKIKTKGFIRSEQETPYKMFHKSVSYTPKQEMKEYHKYYSILKPYLLSDITNFIINSKVATKTNLNTVVEFEKVTYEGKKKIVELVDVYFSSGYLVSTLNVNQVSGTVIYMISKIIKNIEKFLGNASGLSIKRMKESYINILKFTPLKGGSYIELPEELKNKKALINIKNNDERCFEYCVIVGKHKKELDLKHPNRLKQFNRFFEKYNFDTADTVNGFNLTDENIKKYETIVECNINVLIYEDKRVKPFFSSKNGYGKEINLLLISNDTNYHFVYINSLSKLLYNQTTKHHGERFYCTGCLSSFTKKEILDNHNCNGEIIEMPKDDLSFKNWAKCLKCPFVSYADFEALNEKQSTKKGQTTEITSKHVVCGGRYITVNQGKVINEFFDRSKKSNEEFIISIVENCLNLHSKYFYEPKPIEMTMRDNINYAKSKTCHICSELFDVSNEDCRTYFKENKKPHPRSKVRDHCHITGKFRGSAHHQCNLMYRLKPVFPVIFHNLKGYDSHLIIKALSDKYGISNVKVIPTSKEKFISFSLFVDTVKKVYKKETKEHIEIKSNVEIRFIDSFNFLSSSLEKLAENLDTKDFKFTMNFVKNYFKDLNPTEAFRKFCLIKQKGVYPYEYMDSFERFDEKQLPPKSKFVNKLEFETNDYNKLTDKQKASLTADYLHAKLVWEQFNINNLGEYHDLYLKSDVYLLADIFERFRNIAMDKFKLEPCYYYTLPALSWDALLKHTKVKLHLFKEDEVDKYIFMEEAKIGGISGTGGKRYAKANNKYLKNYNPDKLSNYIIYTDANGLYSWAMSQKLPIDSFEWIEPESFNLENIDVDGDYGYFLEVDVELPKEFHDSQNDYPCFPENIEIDDNLLSSSQKKLKEKLKLFDNYSGSKVAKLVPNLMKKEKYKIHFKTLKLWLSLGWKLTKIHRVMKFRQTAWMKDYIVLCMNERKRTNNEFEKDFWKLCCNAVFGKSMENVRKRIDVRITTNEAQVQKLVNKHNCKSVEIINESTYLVDMARQKVVLDKPIYVGIAILNLSKYLMYDFFYNKLRKKYHNCRLLYTDTDSLIFEVFTDDFYEDLQNDHEFKSEWDLSNYDKEHSLYDPTNKKVVGKFKDECGGLVIEEHVGLKAKCYSMKVDTDVEKNKRKNTCKGTKKIVLKNTPHEKYYNAIHHELKQENIIYKEKMSFIKSEKHELYSYTIEKTCLSSFDDKKYLLDDYNEQLSYGHYLIPK